MASCEPPCDGGGLLTIAQGMALSHSWEAEGRAHSGSWSLHAPCPPGVPLKQHYVLSQAFSWKSGRRLGGAGGRSSRSGLLGQSLSLGPDLLLTLGPHPGPEGGFPGLGLVPFHTQCTSGWPGPA